MTRKRTNLSTDRRRGGRFDCGRGNLRLPSPQEKEILKNKKRRGLPDPKAVPAFVRSPRLPGSVLHPDLLAEDRLVGDQRVAVRILFVHIHARDPMVVVRVVVVDSFVGITAGGVEGDLVFVRIFSFCLFFRLCGRYIEGNISIVA